MWCVVVVKKTVFSCHIKTDFTMDSDYEGSDMEPGERKSVYVVTYWDDGEEPVVTVFDNADAATRCMDSFSESHDGCCLDECEVYMEFREW